MAAKNRLVLESRFPAVKRAAGDFLEHAVKKALDEGEHEAERRLERINDSHGYNLPTEVEQARSRLDGRIMYRPFFGRWFEYGAVQLLATPFMRPAHRKMRKRFKDEMGDNFEGFVRRRARVKGARR